MKQGAICEYLEWDSRFFGRRIARAGVNRLTDDAVAEIGAWCLLHKIECLYFLGDAADSITTRLAESNNFNLVDIRLTLEIQVPAQCAPNVSSSRIRGFLEQDIPVLRGIAKTSHRDSRFYFDRNFPVRLCDELYETWIEKSCRGSAHNVLVAEHEGAPVGYITCHLDGPESGQIGLISVRADIQGKGLGKALVCQATNWFAEQEIKTVRVVTQGRNARAQRLYQRCGFVTRSVELWYHRWFVAREENP
jgi:dTDP-4-amino-4,6-dideoxy-D-galactose acyltransferase